MINTRTLSSLRPQHGSQNRCKEYKFRAITSNYSTDWIVYVDPLISLSAIPPPPPPAQPPPSSLSIPSFVDLRWPLKSCRNPLGAYHWLNKDWNKIRILVPRELRSAREKSANELPDMIATEIFKPTKDPTKVTSSIVGNLLGQEIILMLPSKLKISKSVVKVFSAKTQARLKTKVLADSPRFRVDFDIT
ncbi:hypothetical protein M0802_001263 [Mischocyttarus mexicanus]|nr:hypothetical protein M0802_001263 [Mischocyttarus mexicanus]